MFCGPDVAVGRLHRVQQPGLAHRCRASVSRAVRARVPISVVKELFRIFHARGTIPESGCCCCCDPVTTTRYVHWSGCLALAASPSVLTARLRCPGRTGARSSSCSTSPRARTLAPARRVTRSGIGVDVVCHVFASVVPSLRLRVCVCVTGWHAAELHH